MVLLFMKSDEYFMNLALEEAKIAFSENEVPVGAVLVINDEVICKDHNHKEAKLDITSHAEIEVLKQASLLNKSYNLKNATLYVTLEPCLMCCGAILDSKIKRIVFGTTDNEKGAVISKYHCFDCLNVDSTPLISYGIKEAECEQLLKDFFKSVRK